MWGAIISGVIQAGAGLIGASKAAKAQEAYDAKMEEYRKYLMGQMGDNKGLTMQLLAQERNDSRYYKDQQRFRDMMMMNARDYEKGRVRETLDQLFQERNYDIARQGKVDQAAQMDRLYEIREIMKNSNMAANERAFAERELRSLELKLTNERQYEQKTHESNRLEAQDERSWRISQLASDQRKAEMERAEQKINQDRYFGAIDDFSSEIDRVRTSLGDIPSRETYGEADVNRLYERNMADVMPGWKSALTAATSQSEANLIRRGVGTDGADNNSRRAEIAARMSTSLASLSGQARQSAMGEIMNYQSNEDARIAHELNKRGLLMSEAQQATVPQVGMYGQAPQLGSGILNRDVGSAIYTGLPGTSTATTAYQNLPSAIWNQMPGQGSLGQTLGIGSATSNMMPSTSPIAQWLGLNTKTTAGSIYNPTGYLNAMGSTFRSPTADPSTGMQAAGAGLQDVAKNIPWGSMGGTSSFPGYGGAYDASNPYTWSWG
jgi:hypothetical protein